MNLATDSAHSSTKPAKARKTGRPRGSRTRRGHARLATPSELALYVRRLGRRVRDARLESDVSVITLAAHAGVLPSTIHYLERGERDVRVRVIIAIAIALGLDPYELMA